MGRWLAVLAPLAVAHFASVWLAVPECLVLATIPIAISASVLGFAAATALTGAETLLLAVLLGLDVAGVDATAAAVTLLGIWLTLAVTYATRRPFHQLAAWLEEYFGRTQSCLKRRVTARLNWRCAGGPDPSQSPACPGQRAHGSLRTIAEQAQKAKAAFAANVSHEFRTPLNMIIGLVDVMIKSPHVYATALSPKMRADLEIINRNCEHLANMVNDVLDLTRTEAGRLTLHREWVELGELVRRSAEIVLPLTEKKRLALHIEVPEDLPMAYCDRVRTQQVILNLLSNAARFAKRVPSPSRPHATISKFASV